MCKCGQCVCPTWRIPCPKDSGGSPGRPNRGDYRYRINKMMGVYLVLLVLMNGAEASSLLHRTVRASAKSVSDIAPLYSSPIAAQFWTGNHSLNLNHLVHNSLTNVLYVGGTNRLFELDANNLDVKAAVETGPRFDSPKCHASGCGPERDQKIKTQLTDNVNKVLLLDPSTSSLLMCGSVSQGACEKFRTANLSLTPEFIPRSIAANDETSSTYAFIGPEQIKPWGSSSHALYVGTTFTTVGEYRNDVPAISTRNLYNLDYAELSFSEQSMIRIDVKYRDHFLVKYVYGFNATKYAYFVIVQKKSHLPGQEEAGYISRLARSCMSDANYNSYTEVTLECQGPDDTNYNLVQDAKLAVAGKDLAESMGLEPGEPILIATFSPSNGHTDQPTKSSAVCAFSMKDIDAKFNENIHMCFNGSMLYRNMEYVSGPILNGKCPAAGSVGNIFDFCLVGLKISGISPIHSRAALTFPKTFLTAIQSAVTSRHTVLFLGTDSGHLIKALMTSAESATQYGEDVIDPGNNVLPDMFVDPDGHFLYILTTTRVTKYRVENCASYTNCSSCLEARDPYCGWCSLEKRCTVQSACQMATFSSPRWLSFGAGQQCIDFEMILPDRFPIDQMTVVQLTIRTLPELPPGAKYQCVWGKATPTDAVVTKAGLTCHTPILDERPPIPAESDHVLVPLSVRSSETNKNFVSRDFAFYSCEKHTVCGTCVRSEWACNWCIYENICTHNASSCGGTVVSGKNNPAQFSSHGSGFCPKLWTDAPSLLAADNARTELSLLVQNLPHPRVGQLGFQCMVEIEGAKMMVNARVSKNLGPQDIWTTFNGSTIGIGSRRLQRVVCDATVYHYESQIGTYDAKVTLVWNRDHYVDSRNLTLYKCGVLGSHRGHHDCSLCVTRPERYQCAWCGSACTYKPQCPSAGEQAQPLMHTELAGPDVIPGITRLGHCPTPRIDVIQPLAGPLEGGTLVTIEGSNLGLKEEDILGQVFIGNVPCKVEDYDVSVKIKCRTGPAPIRSRDGSDLMFSVRVATPAGTTQSTVKFTYTNVSVTDVWPSRGPLSGGTVLSISGRFLNVGSHVSATLDNLPCIINTTQSSSHRLVCVTSKYYHPDEIDSVHDDNLRKPKEIRYLTVVVDGAERTLQTPFTYTPDPIIHEMKPLKTSWSGGRVITVHGRHFDSIQTPKIIVLIQDKVLNSSLCKVLGPSLMECPSPALNREYVYSILESMENPRRRRSLNTQKRSTRKPMVTEHDEVSLDIGFIMDGVTTVRHLRKHFPGVRSRLTFVSDPKYNMFPRNIKLYKGDTLVIEGERINTAADESDVTVTVGRAICNVTSVAATQLVCTPPEDQPPPTDEHGHVTQDSLPLVVVHVGHLRFPLGVLRYERNRHFPLSPEGIACLAGGAVFIVLASFVALVIYRRKSSHAERVYKLMQLQMDSLESHVRTECKQAFAELQTDMTDLTADLESSGIPTLDPRTYVMKVFFPGVTDHPILNDPKIHMQGPRTNYDVAMLQFEQLLANKNFLLAFIDTLESQKSFNIRDKVNVASLMTVLLLGRMEYLTEVLRLLLLRLITTSAASKHPQLMLRRTESVVEKMLTNWLALCMYHHLKEDAGTSLFLLFKAIKHQIEKGPVDAITNDARYSLSEEKLLREQVDANPVVIHLLHDDPHYEKIPYQTTYSVCTCPVMPMPMHTLSCFNTLAMYSEEYEEKVQVKVLDCDTISQVKNKILDALYRNTPYSLRPSVHDLDLEWRHGRAGRVILSDEDRTTVVQAGGWRKLNTLQHYGVRDSAVMALIPRQNDSFSSNCTGYYSYANSISPLNSPGVEGGTDTLGGRSNLTSPGHSYHFVRSAEDTTASSPVNREARNERNYGTHKAIPEIFLTRLLSTKGTIQKFVDDFFRTILSPNDGLPPPVKWLFDLLDEAARAHGINDQEIIHAWKSNCLPLRFWVNFIKNPDFIFDINKTPTVDACLSVISQTFIDSCSTSEHRLGKDSPSNKLLFAKDIPKYRTQVTNFYSDISTTQPISEQELGQQMQQLSRSFANQFDNLSALKELYIYVTRYYDLIYEALDADQYCRKLNLAHRLQSISYILESYSHSNHSGPVVPMPPVQLAGQLSEL